MITIIVVTVSFHVALALWTNRRDLGWHLSPLLVPLFLGGILYVFLYRGANWARWITGVLLALSGLGALYGFALSVSAGESWLSGWANAAIALIHLGSVYVLFFVRPVRAYFAQVP